MVVAIQVATRPLRRTRDNSGLEGNMEGITVKMTLNRVNDYKYVFFIKRICPIHFTCVVQIFMTIG